MKAKISSCYFDKSLSRDVNKGEIIEVDESKVERLKTIGITCEEVVEDEAIEVKAAKRKSVADKKTDGK